MTRLVVGRVGPATSVQDLGRHGWQRYGLVPAGAVDRFALAVANTLVRRPPNAAAIEIGPSPTEFVVIEGVARVAFSGATRLIRIGRQTAEMAMTHLVSEGEAIVIEAAKSGVFTYMAFEGGFSGEPELGSLSVHQRAGMGSPYPRPLRTGDTLTLGHCQPWEAELELPLDPDTAADIRVILGPQHHYFSPTTIAQFLTADWRVSAASDRMAYRLLGEPLQHMNGYNIVSDGTVNGSIQVPGNGLPIVLMPDRGTTGGYPKIAVVISADLGRMAQVPAGKVVRFRAVDIDEAQEAARSVAAELAALPRLVAPRHGSPPTRLFETNVAGDAVDAFDPGSWSIGDGRD